MQRDYEEADASITAVIDQLGLVAVEQLSLQVSLTGPRALGDSISTGQASLRRQRSWCVARQVVLIRFRPLETLVPSTSLILKGIACVSGVTRGWPLSGPCMD